MSRHSFKRILKFFHLCRDHRQVLKKGGLKKDLFSFQVSVIKAKIHDETGMPAGKQKLLYEVSKLWF